MVAKGFVAVKAAISRRWGLVYGQYVRENAVNHSENDSSGSSGEENGGKESVDNIA